MTLRRLDIISIGIAVSAVVFVYAYFHIFMPNIIEANYYDEYASALKTEADKLPKANRRVKMAEETISELTARWQNIVLKKTPPQSAEQGGIELGTNRWQLTVDARKFRDNLQQAVNKQLKHGGVTVMQGPQIPFPPADAGQIVESYFNYPAIPFPVAIFDLGIVTVKGKLEQITQNILGWNNFPHYMAVTEGLKLKGTSPNIIATYNLTIVAYIRAKEVPPKVPEDTTLSRPLQTPAPGARRTRGGTRS